MNIVPSEMEISADEEEVDRLLTRSRTLFNVPDYQRRYAWDEDQWEEFWQDLQTLLNGRPKHFLGSIVVIKHKEDDLERLELVDGQQRMATIAVLLSALQGQFRERGEEKQADKIDDKLEFEHRDTTHKRVELTKYDQKEFAAILDRNWALIDETDSQILRCYEWFDEKLNTLQLSDLTDIRINLTSSMSVVQVTCDSEMSAFRLFETLNNRGLQLSPVDLMKNHLFQVIAEDDKIDATQIKDLWEAILTTLDGVSKDLRKFFQHYLMSTRIIPEDTAVTGNTLYDTFTEKLEEVVSKDEMTVESYIGDMLEKARVYDRMLRNDLDRADVFGSDPSPVNAKLKDLEYIDVENAYILLLRALDEMDDKSKVLSVIRLMEVLILRRRTVGKPTGTDEMRIFARTTSTEFDKPDILEAIENRFVSQTPSDEEFETSIQTESFNRSDQTRYILDMLDRHGFKGGSMSKLRTIGEVDIEHIAPRRMSADKYTNWVDYLGIDGEEFERRYRDRIGNLTLLEEGANRSNKDALFDKKADDYAKSEFDISNEHIGYDEWSIENIEKRSKKLADKANAVWSYENVS